MENLIITAAICGAEVTKQHNPNIPYTLEELAKEAELAYKEGASIIHLHVREDDGTPTQSKERFQEASTRIKEICPDVIILPSTGGAVGMSTQERLQSIYVKPTPEMATLDCGTMNFGGDEIFENTESMMEIFAKEMHELGIKPELECFDIGMINTVLRFKKKAIFQTPLHFNLVLGVRGGIDATLENLVYMMNSIPKGSTFSVTGIGQYEFPMAAAAIISGGHVRVGFEDNIYLSKGKLAKSNAELVRKAKRIAGELGRNVATPTEARQILGLEPK
ncbi:MAG: 3-keto-5-aminohexanoate cleavage enzyme [Promethearchaeota archaeon]|nr:MAG: 3-keto-5-aminohexanoate cleavage enzyme [Candidatus Lokiarchaeota archaeon]